MMGAVNPADRYVDVAALTEIPMRGARTVATVCGDIALFRTSDNKVFALRDRCPHKGGPLSQGIVHGNAVSCPLHSWVISLIDGTPQGEDAVCVPRFAVRIEGGRILLNVSAGV